MFASAGRGFVSPRHFCCFYALSLFLGFFVLALLPLSAAFAAGGQASIKITKIAKGTKVLFEAERMNYYERRDTVVAVGNVHLYYGPYSLRADRVKWERRIDKVTAVGNVVFRDSTGNLVSAPHAILVDKFREGFLQAVSVVMTNNAKIAAVTAERFDGNVTVLNKAVYSPCKTCSEHPERAPLWQIKSVKVTHDQQAKTIYYRNASFEFFGAPVAYLPYFSHPDPSVKRRTGFLVPGVTYSRRHGAGVKVPFFINLAPNYDLTLSPTFTTRRGPLLQAAWRHRTMNGEYLIRPTGIREFNWYGSDDRVKKWRGGIETEGRFNLNKYWSWGWNVWATSDDTFLSEYGLNSQSDLVSNLFLKGLGSRNYFSAELIHFRGLLDTDSKSTTPLVHPLIDYNVIFNEPVFGGEMGIDSNVMSLTRKEGADSHRFSSQLHWKRTFTAAMGQRITPFWSLRGDFYKTNNAAGSSRASDSFVRAMPAAGIEYRWPFININSWGTQIFTPIAQIVLRPGEVKSGRVSNEDSQTIEFDEINLFSHDKFDGLDRVEGGVRANLGFNYRLDHVYGGYADLTFGQSIHLAGRNSFGTDTGLESKRSDFVGGLRFSPYRGFTIGSQLRFDKETFSINRHDFDIEGRYGRLWGKALYTSLKAQPAQGLTEDREEVDADISYNVTDNWKILAGARFDIEGRRAIEQNLGLNYDDECFSATFSVENKFTHDREVKRDLKFSLSITLKTLGASKVSSTANRAVR